MAFSRLLYVFVKIDIWISLNRYMDSFQLIYELCIAHLIISAVHGPLAE